MPVFALAELLDVKETPIHARLVTDSKGLLSCELMHGCHYGYFLNFCDSSF
jgi:hypothetical protein